MSQARITISKQPQELPDIIKFLSTGEVLEMQADIYETKNVKINGRNKRVRTKLSSATYIYTKVPEKSKKLSTTVDLDIQYIQRLNLFGLIEFSFSTGE